ncbi:MAG TPA: phosphoglycerate kinase [Candidatus Paceibacterota bacterium]|nr:phosphoglycerate kinase [Candidatus Paceibacterota bacterium]
MRGIHDIEILENIPVLVRTSLNVPVQAGKVSDTFRLQSALPTIQFLKERYARVILISHITGTGTETLAPMYEAMREWIPNLVWCPVSVGAQARAAIRELPPGGVLMLENLRRNRGEEANDPEFAKELAMLADVFVQDSFDVCHREHASVVGVPALLPSYAGLTLEAEIAHLSQALSPKDPSLAIIGGAKFSTKEPVLRRLLELYDHVFVGGALANDFLKARGYAVGASLTSHDQNPAIKELLRSPKLLTPVDVVVAKRGEKRDQAREAKPDGIQTDEMVLDVGPHTTEALVDLIMKAKTVLWNGPLGKYEDGFTDATRTLSRALTASNARSVIGGGDTVAALSDFGFAGERAFLSTGGGAMLDYLSYGTLPGLEVLS